MYCKPEEMINQFEVSMYLQEALPELKNELILTPNDNAYTAMHSLLDVTCRKVKESNYKTAKKCLKIASKLYDRGNQTVKNAVENVYVYSLSNILYARSVDKAKILAIIPMTLYTLYIKQVSQSGC